MVEPLPIIVYRLPWTWKCSKLLMKSIHAGLNFVAAILAIISLVAVFDFHNTLNIPNMYSLHSWIGLTAVILYVLQLVRPGLAPRPLHHLRILEPELCGEPSTHLTHSFSDIAFKMPRTHKLHSQWQNRFFIFLLPWAPLSLRAFLMPIHVYSGLLIFGTVIATALMGDAELAAPLAPRAQRLYHGCRRLSEGLGCLRTAGRTGPPRSKAKAGDLAACLLRRKAFRKPPQRRRLSEGLGRRRTAGRTGPPRSKAKAGDLAACLLRRKAFRKPPQRRRLSEGLGRRRTAGRTGPPRSKAKAGDLAACLLRRKAFRKPPQRRRLSEGLGHRRTARWCTRKRPGYDTFPPEGVFANTLGLLILSPDHNGNVLQEPASIRLQPNGGTPEGVEGSMAINFGNTDKSDSELNNEAAARKRNVALDESGQRSTMLMHQQSQSSRGNADYRKLGSENGIKQEDLDSRKSSTVVQECNLG
ncbi:hypothetical protein QTO34_002929 [Cnephaeus nilssonii]|uniref:Plasma membrane ascorbate-dependent reductase CYBRD1 n=1 Tax=Cnephaeus nilssonii TaxID=3371016 RepID=A0AA40HT84_CNENI|nr:hypothetical protein QTO34_002929 [Eptesicus nilssonii]